MNKRILVLSAVAGGFLLMNPFIGAAQEKPLVRTDRPVVKAQSGAVVTIQFAVRSNPKDEMCFCRRPKRGCGCGIQRHDPPPRHHDPQPPPPPKRVGRIIFR